MDRPLPANGIFSDHAKVLAVALARGGLAQSAVTIAIGIGAGYRSVGLPTEWSVGTMARRSAKSVAKHLTAITRTRESLGRKWSSPSGNTDRQQILGFDS
jgi:hypothetical protein